MIAYRPKTLFQANTAEREKWQQIAGDPVTQRAIAYAQADMAMSGLNPDEMRGANAFILILLNLSEEIPVVKPLPMKSLKSFDEPQEPNR